MAQASSAQREPSMEEILASIRRIIEESDTAAGKKPADIAQDPAEEDVVESRPQGAVIEVDAFRSELRGAPAAAKADVAERAEAGEQEADAGITLATASPAVTSVVDDDPVMAAFAAEPLSVSETDADVAGQEDEPAPDAQAGSGLGGPSADFTEGGSTAGAESRQALDFDRPALISEQPGRQVAAAFGELSDAFAASRRKSFDEMAEEMLRPMLQDWLDNNLPTLVEKLVREEIERVARGSSR